MTKSKQLPLPPSAALSHLTEEKAARKGDLMGNKIHVDTFLIPHHSFCRRLCSVSLVFLLCALTEVQSNYWNIWMTGPSLYPLANGAWLLQKGMGRTLVPLTDMSHQRSMTSHTLVSLRRTLVKIWHVMTFILKSNNQAKDMNHNQEAESSQRFWWEEELDLGWNLVFCFPLNLPILHRGSNQRLCLL